MIAGTLAALLLLALTVGVAVGLVVVHWYHPEDRS
jgi:hypothetical protein